MAANGSLADGVPADLPADGGLWIGVDLGGSFTDVVLYDATSGSLRVEKTPSTPEDGSIGIAAGIARLSVDLAEVVKFAHATTLATNTMLEYKGARTAVLTTRGFRDVLEVGRGNRTKMYDITATRPRPLVPRSRVKEVDERTLFDGTVLASVDTGQLEAIAAELEAEGIEALAVCFLHSYANPANERVAKLWLGKRLPGILVATSADVLPEIREYERFATATANIYIAPRMQRYLQTLKQRLAEGGYAGEVSIMASNGGAWPLERMAESPVNSVLSGPAAGVIGATELGALIGETNLITCDMGGTSTDTCLISQGAFAMTTDGRIGQLPIRMTQIDINSIGAGAGSLAWLAAGNFLNVGPESAGAVPGPACYGRGGTEPTVTDANVLLGRLGTTEKLGGEITLDRDAAERALAGLAAKVGIETLALAEGIIDLAVAKMTASVKEISVMRGFDPREFALFAYGGAGPLHAAMVADQLGCRKVLVPPLPGVFSALGLLMADTRHDFVRTRLMSLSQTTFPELLDDVEQLRDAARHSLTALGFAEDRIRFFTTLDMRYEGQAFELSVLMPEHLDSLETVFTTFQEAYERRYAYRADDPAEIVNVRMAGYGLTRKPSLAALRPASTGKVPDKRRSVVFSGDTLDTLIVDRESMAAEATIHGPAVIEEIGSTTVVPPGFRASVHETGLLAIERD
jgi:N-methylhydantoinase A